jgi:glycosyltransferase involved in cell wall biosynthesis
MDFSNKFEKNVGMFCVETSNVLYTGWPIRFEQMDEIWMPDRHSLNAVKESKIKTPAKVIPIPTDITKYQQKLGKLDLGIPEGTFIFYFIGEFHRRKNLLSLLKAFHTEFGRQEPVALVLKTNGDIEAINEMCNKIKNGLKMYPSIHNYHQETIINHRLSDEDILKLHETGDCFVMPSYGETWAIPAFDAMAKGNVVISTQVGGMQDYLQSCGRLVGGREEPVFALFETFQDTGTSYENWTSVDINLLRKAMRGAYIFMKLESCGLIILELQKRINRIQRLAGENSRRFWKLSLGQTLKDLRGQISNARRPHCNKDSRQRSRAKVLRDLSRI